MFTASKVFGMMLCVTTLVTCLLWLLPATGFNRLIAASLSLAMVAGGIVWLFLFLFLLPREPLWVRGGQAGLGLFVISLWVDTLCQICTGSQPASGNGRSSGDQLVGAVVLTYIFIGAISDLSELRSIIGEGRTWVERTRWSAVKLAGVFGNVVLLIFIIFFVMLLRSIAMGDVGQIAPPCVNALYSQCRVAQ